MTSRLHQRTPDDILRSAFERASNSQGTPLVSVRSIRSRLEFVCNCVGNRAGVRLLMSCLLARIHNPAINPLKPYTEVGTPDCFSGRTFDEQYITHFINEHHLPCNPTTAFLTPALRNLNTPLSTGIELVGRPHRLYVDAIELLTAVASNQVGPEDLLAETVRLLLALRDQRRVRLESLLANQQTGPRYPMSSEDIIGLLEQHLACKYSSRLPVLVVAAAYGAASGQLGERTLPLTAHNAADLQTGAIGDVSVCLTNSENVVTAYEMKSRPVTVDDIDAALEKVVRYESHVDNYIFITTEDIDEDAAEYANSLYDRNGGTEIAILDSVGFIRHFLHLFHRARGAFLDLYQELVLAEPESAVNPALKEAFLVLRQAAEVEA